MNEVTGKKKLNWVYLRRFSPGKGSPGMIVSNKCVAGGDAILSLCLCIFSGVCPCRSKQKTLCFTQTKKERAID